MNPAPAPAARHSPVSQSALVVEVPEAEVLVASWRRLHDPVARRGMPAHITALFPFVPPDALDDEVLDRVRRIAAATDLGRQRLTEVAAFPAAVYLRPDPDAPWRALTRALWDEFPEHPPYEGRHPDSIPHLTVAMTGTAVDRTALLVAIGNDIGPRLPLDVRPAGLSVFTSDEQGRWSRRALLPFAPGTS